MEIYAFTNENLIGDESGSRQFLIEYWYELNGQDSLSTF